MVDAITAVSASSATTPVRVESSLSITSEPDNRWVAERQSQIDSDQVAQKNRHTDVDVGDERRLAEAEEEELPLFEDIRASGKHGKHRISPKALSPKLKTSYCRAKASALERPILMKIRPLAIALQLSEDLTWARSRFPEAGHHIVTNDASPRFSETD